MSFSPEQQSPHSLDAELMVLGSIFIDPESIHNLSGLQADHFFDPVYREIYTAMCQLRDANEQIDFLLVMDKLGEKSKVQNLGGTEFLMKLAEKTPSSSVVEKYAAIVTKHGIKRDYIAVAQSIASDANNEELSAIDVQALAEQKLLSVGDHRTLSNFTPTAEYTDRWFSAFSENQSLSEKERDARRIRTRYAELDSKVDFQRGNMIVLAGRPAMGKTAFALSIIMQTCQQGKPVGFFSYEMTGNQIMDRMVSSLVGVQSQDLHGKKLDDETLQKIGPALSQINEYPLFMDNNTDRSLTTLVSRARRLKKLHNIELLVIDYLQQVFTTEKFAQQSRLQMTSHVSNTIKNLALELDIPILVMSQLSRSCENRPNKQPQLSDLRESGEIEQDADIVMMMYRDDYYEEDSDRPNMVDVFIRKNRMGGNGAVELYFDRDYQRFSMVDKKRNSEVAG